MKINKKLILFLIFGLIASLNFVSADEEDGIFVVYLKVLKYEIY